MDEHVYKRHNKTLLLYHLVFPLKYRKKCLDENSGQSLKTICLGISERYEIQFIEIGFESDHVPFLVQGIPSMSISKLVTINSAFDSCTTINTFISIGKCPCLLANELTNPNTLFIFSFVQVNFIYLINKLVFHSPNLNLHWFILYIKQL